VLARRSDGVLERAPSIRAEPLEARELQLDRDARGRGRVDHRAAMRGQCLENGLGPDRDRPQA
jgi:hypothetical protein